jgi:hypothetical protein
MNSEITRIKLHCKNQLWGFYPDEDFLILKKVPVQSQEVINGITHIKDNPDLYCTYVTFGYKNKKLIWQDWREVLPMIVSLGISANIASQGVDYLKKGGKQLILNIHSNSVIIGKKVLRGDMMFPPSENELAAIKTELKNERITKIKHQFKFK